LKASGDIGESLVTDLISSIIYECAVPDDWLKSVIVNVYKGKGDALERGNYYRDIKLLDQIMKVMESCGGFHEGKSEYRWDAVWL